ncbi:MAG: DNA mismatch repair protein MutS [Bacilli bacterium]|jgi:DNA mismatch repair protein MutS|nr:DNA mismatch repair protein MutS [Bacilli bacterium]
MEIDKVYDLVTPMMKQYIDIKRKYMDCIVFYRLGDFYEMFFDDALIASNILSIALTGRNAGLDQRVPMCGIPYHAYESYLKRLLDEGYKVAICEQLSEAGIGKMVDRGVIKVLTPGSYTDNESISYNFLMFIDDTKPNYYYLALADLSTGKLKAKKIIKDVNKLINIILEYQIKEIVLRDKFDTSIFNNLLKTYRLLISFNFNQDHSNPYLNEINKEYYDAFSNLFNYIKTIQFNDIDYYLEIEYDNKDSMSLDYNAKYNLELITSIRNNDKYGTLFWYLDKTKTAMGSRKLKEIIENPLIKKELIINRQNFIKVLLSDVIKTEKIRKYLQEVYDIERLVVRLASNNINVKELLWLNNSLKASYEIFNLLKEFNNDIINNYLNDIKDVHEVISLIEQSIPIEILDGNNEKIIKDGYNEQLDEYRNILNDSTSWLLNFEQKQREITGINNLKVKYHKTFGYYIEVSNANKHLIKDEFNYIRKQTLTNGERYINVELKEKESQILSAQDNVNKLEIILFNDIVKELNKFIKDMQDIASKLSYIDVMQALSKISNQSDYTCPIFNDEHKIDIKSSFHPIIKQINKEQEFINNDFMMGSDINTMIITGPNMGGKSTYERQLALIIIMAQIGCYVPAQEANLMIFDNIFTRIGASDNLIQGQSTFMVEMLEASNAILNASENSLIIFDEIGRGTATYDGMSLAGAIIEYITSQIKAKLLFSTHYHELVELANTNDSIVNYHASVIENDKEIILTYKIKPGSIDRSYGLHVASLANIPNPILKRAESLLNNFEIDNNNINKVEYVEVIKDSNEEVVKLINDIKLDELTGIDALLLLKELKDKLK